MRSKSTSKVEPLRSKSAGKEASRCSGKGRTVSMGSAKLSRLCLLCVLLLVSSITHTGCTEADGPVSRDGYYLDTICSVSIYAIKGEDGSPVPASEADEAAEAALDNAFALCERLEDTLSRTRESSDISRANAAGGEWVSVSADTAALVKKGLAWSELSGGGFDISVGGVTKLWDFHAAEGEAKLPDASELTEAVKHVDYRKIETDGERLRISDPETELDLGGIAKGYIGDRMAESLEADGVVSATINLGGNVVCVGGKTKEEDFVIGVETPFSDRTEIIGKISARDKTLVTSGVYERRIEVDGKTYHHILDTSTGMPAKTDLDAVTLIADKGRSADIDALSTTCLIKGADEGIRLIEATDGVEGVFVLSDGSIRQTDGAGFEENK